MQMARDVKTGTLEILDTTVPPEMRMARRSLPTTEGARGAGGSGSRDGVGAWSNPGGHADEESGSGEDRGSVLLGRAGFRALLAASEIWRKWSD